MEGSTTNSGVRFGGRMEGMEEGGEGRKWPQVTPEVGGFGFRLRES